MRAVLVRVWAQLLLQGHQHRSCVQVQRVAGRVQLQRQRRVESLHATRSSRNNSNQRKHAVGNARCRHDTTAHPHKRHVTTPLATRTCCMVRMPWPYFSARRMSATNCDGITFPAHGHARGTTNSHACGATKPYLTHLLQSFAVSPCPTPTLRTSARAPLRNPIPSQRH